MKKTMKFVLYLFMIMSLTACGHSADESIIQGNGTDSTTNDTTQEKEREFDDASNSDGTENQPDESKEIKEEILDESSNSEGGSNNDVIENQPEKPEIPNVTPDDNSNLIDSSDPAENQPEEIEIPEEQKAKVLVAYFSATNTTEGIAEHIANGLNADLYEIVPEVPYTTADLNYNDNNSRSSIEMNDANARPAISGSVDNMQEYDIVFIGYPIWWGDAPKIINTFLENYDFSGKTIVPFCTSGSSGIGSSAVDLQQRTSGANWLGGERFNGNDSQDAILKWVDSLDLDLEE